MAVILIAITGLAYFRRGWVRHIEKRNAPPAAPVDVSRQSAGINFKKVEENRTVFEVAASKSTEFKGQDANLLEDVRITIYGKNGERHDVIHTHSCEYGRENGGINCSGEVQIELMSAADAARVELHPEMSRTVTTKIATRGVHFDRASGLAQTTEKVTFTFPNGTGDARGLEYKSEEGTVRLLHDAHFKLIQNAPATAKASTGVSRAGTVQEVEVSGTSLDFGRDTRLMRLAGPAEARTANQLLRAGEIRLSLDKDFHAETMVASGSGAGRPELSSVGGPDEVHLQAESISAHFSPQGAVTRLEAGGAIQATRKTGTEQEEATADAASLKLSPWQGRPEELDLEGNVLLQTRGSQNESRLLRTAAFRLEFGQGEPGHAGKARKAETLAAGTMEWTDAPVSPGAAPGKTKLQADRLSMEFADTGKARRLLANGNVQTERTNPGKLTQTATARNGVVDLQPSGGWSEMNLDGEVQVKQGDRAGESGHAVFVRASQTATLTGNAMVRDSSTETRAPKITFVQDSGEIRAEGGVRSADFSSRTSAVQLTPAPANISANRLDANSKTGRALYTGHARLWQGDSVLEAESIELLRETRILNATGNVRAVFPQASAPDGPGSRAGQAAATFTPTALTAALLSKNPAKTHLWHVSSGTLMYSDKENRAHLEQSVMVQSAEQKMRAPVLDLYFTRATTDARPTTGSGQGAQQISRAVGAGGVTVEEGGRKAVAERGEYIAADGKFVMSGGNPTLYDGSAGTTTGRQLTFFLADDTIIVDSENGSRTLTKHRVEK